MSVPHRIVPGYRAECVARVALQPDEQPTKFLTKRFLSSLREKSNKIWIAVKGCRWGDNLCHQLMVLAEATVVASGYLNWPSSASFSNTIYKENTELE